MLSRIAFRISSSLSEQPDYGSGSASVPRGFDLTSDVVKTRNKDEWCVVSPKNDTWSGGCYGSPERAEERLEEIERIKHAQK
jgi:hypothetical protein